MINSVWLISAYLPPVEYFTKLLLFDRIYIEQHDHYMKETYRNRCRICGPNGIINLTVPVVKPETIKCEMKDIRISDHGKWRHLHWNAIESSYNTTPYYEFYKDDFAHLFERDYTFLIDFNDALLNLVCDLINIHPTLHRTDEYKQIFNPGEYDCREMINPKKNYQLTDVDFTPQPYYQVFQEKFGFIPNLSIIDMLFNCGPESLILLKK
jgi:hypothetical protein